MQHYTDYARTVHNYTRLYETLQSSKITNTYKTTQNSNQIYISIQHLHSLLNSTHFTQLHKNTTLENTLPIFPNLSNLQNFYKIAQNLRKKT